MLKIRANVKQAEVELPMGIYLKKTNKVYNTCTVEAMDGDSEEQISEKKIRNNGAKIVTKLLATKIKKVGDVEFPDGVGESIAREMFSDDRDTCLIKMRQLMKDEMEIETTCPTCGNKEVFHISMEKILKDNSKWGANEKLHGDVLGEVAFELPDGLIVEDDETKETLICKKGILKLPNGVVEENIAQNAMSNSGVANTLILSSCVQKIENIRKVDKYVIRAMSRVDREYLSNIIESAKPGPKFIKERECDSCNNEYKFMLQLPYFFTSGISRIK